MVSRRICSGNAGTKIKPFCFGLFTDVHYANRPADGTRYFARAVDKIHVCLNAMQRHGVAFAVCLGDLIEVNANPAIQQSDLARVANVLLSQSFPVHLVLGNHDADAFTRQQLAHSLKAPNLANGYDTFMYHGVQFIILDSNYHQDETPFVPGTVVWDNCYIGPVQQTWLKQTLNMATAPCFILQHAMLDDYQNPHVVKNADEVREIIQKSGKVSAVFQGHNHAGYTSVNHNIPYLTLPAMVEGETGLSYRIVSVDETGAYHMACYSGLI